MVSKGMVRAAAVALSAAALGGCVTFGSAPGGLTNVQGSQVGRPMRALPGTVMTARPVEIAGNGRLTGTATGAALGGIAGSTVGGSSAGRAAGAILGIALGGWAGSEAQGAIGAANGVEIVLRLDGGRTLAIVQPATADVFRPGDPVLLLEGAGPARVVHQ